MLSGALFADENIVAYDLRTIFLMLDAFEGLAVVIALLVAALYFMAKKAKNH